MDSSIAVTRSRSAIDNRGCGKKPTQGSDDPFLFVDISDDDSASRDVLSLRKPDGFSL